MPGSLEDRIEESLELRPERITPLHGGDIGEVYRVDFRGKDSIVAKVASRGSGTLDIEAMMLRYLAKNSDLPVPEVLHSESTLLLMTFIEGTSHLDDAAQAHAAELLAALHQIRADQFGFEQDTLIGSLHQPNPWTQSWLVFFRDHRLFYMAREAVREGALPTSILARLERFCANLDQWLYEPEHPALLHGDMWTTNILASNGRITGFLDPAVYYGHPEIELAFSTLFGTFGKPFFRRYRELHTLPPGFMELRRDLYNLYPLLVHVRLFGGMYVSSVDRILRAIGF
jgi:fructosamine-3-kinase